MSWQSLQLPRFDPELPSEHYSAVRTVTLGGVFKPGDALPGGVGPRLLRVLYEARLIAPSPKQNEIKPAEPGKAKRR